MSEILAHSALIAGFLSVILLSISLFGNTRNDEGRLTRTGSAAIVVLVLFCFFVINATIQTHKSMQDIILAYSALIAGFLSVILLGISLFGNTRNDEGGLTRTGSAAIVVLVLFCFFAINATMQTAQDMSNIIKNLDFASDKTDTISRNLGEVLKQSAALTGYIDSSLGLGDDRRAPNLLSEIDRQLGLEKSDDTVSLVDRLEDRMGIDNSQTLAERFGQQLGITDSTDLWRHIEKSFENSDTTVKNYLQRRIGIADSINLQQYVDKQVVKVVRDSFESIQNTLAIILRRLPDSTNTTGTGATGNQ